MKSIKEITKELNISSRTIRYYEDLFKLNSVKKSNVRYYDDFEINKIKIIIVFRKLNFSLNEIKSLMIDFKQNKIFDIINEEKQKHLKNIKETTNYLALLNELKLLVAKINDDKLEDFVLNDLYPSYKEGTNNHIIERTNKKHLVIDYFFESIKNANLLPFKKYCHEKMEMSILEDLFIKNLKLTENLVNYKIHSEYSLYNGNVFVVINTKKEKITLKIIFNVEDVVVGIWIIEYIKL